MNDSTVPIVNGGASTTASGTSVDEWGAIAELMNIAYAKRFDRHHFRDDTDYADWVQSRAQFALLTLKVDGTAPETSTRSADE